MTPGAGRGVLSPADTVLGVGTAPGGAGKSGGLLVYMYIYIRHTLETCAVTLHARHGRGSEKQGGGVFKDQAGKIINHSCNSALSGNMP